MSATHSSVGEHADGSSSSEVPQNGLKGLKHWKYDLLAGVVVSLVSLPLSSGIAIASGAPPIYGLISAIIAGLIYPALGGSYVTISGPAAGLAPALVAIMVSLGGAGDATTVGAGYHKLLVVIFFVGLFQLFIARTGLAKFAAVFPAVVVEGMLAAIGVLILVKALPLILGVLDSGHPHGFIEYLSHVPGWVGSATWPAAAVGAVTLIVMLLATSRRAQMFKAFRVIPAHMWGVGVAVPMGLALALESIDRRLLIQVPENPLAGVGLPAFGDVAADLSLWGAVVIGVVTLLLIDGVESLATAQAVDRIDPFKRTSDPNRVLQAMGISNMVSSLVGGLTVIPGGVKSKTNIEAGGRTLWSNFVNASMLLLFLFVAPGLIHLIPTAALGGILVYTGWKMAHPRIAKHVAAIGYEQLGIYGITVVTTLLTDLLIGVAVGTLCKLGLLVIYAHKESVDSGGALTTWSIVADMFRDPVVAEHVEGESLRLEIGRSLVSFNAFRLKEHLLRLPDSVRRIVIDVTERAAMCDHTACESVYATQRIVPDREVEVRGLSEMIRLGTRPDSIRLQDSRRLVRALR